MDNSKSTFDDETNECLNQLSKYLDIIGNETRIKILKILQNKPKNARTIAHLLKEHWDLNVSIPNLKKHLELLIEIGVVTKRLVSKDKPDQTDYSNLQGQVVMQYKLVPESLDNILNDLYVLREYKSERTLDLKEIKDIDLLIDDITNQFASTTTIILLENEKIIYEYPLEKKCNIIGRIHSNHQNDVTLPDKDLTVGRKHATITYGLKKYYLEDLGSKNGTYLMDSDKQFKKLEPNTPIELKDGDTIRFGLLNTIVVFREVNV